ncbi:hypothetical protein QE152_g4493 [Popillia japonica]|uniref:Uncharacterized protein n=1 Tax=Popillia japonica TaxID=7064 RepID=A0AAW1MVP2_POPJA
MENENIVLKETLSKARHKLAEATTQINKFSKENENIVLKETLSKTRHKLAEATTQINKFSKEQLSNKIKRHKYNETVNALEHEKESLKAEVHDLSEEKKSN